MTSSDKDFVAATIQAIGRCASNISEVTDTCMNGLMGLMANRDGKGLCTSMFTSVLPLSSYVAIFSESVYKLAQETFRN